MKMSIPQKLDVETWSIDRLIPYARNPRKNDAAVDRMAASVQEFSWKIPILARSNGEVIDGHLRLKAAKKLGIDQLPVILCDEWSEVQVKAFRLLVNRSVTWADWDEELLGLELAELKGLDFDLNLTGFDSRELDSLLAIGGETDEEACPDPPTEPVSLPGDVWRCGSHSVLCADATDGSAMKRLMELDKADLVFSDPPYNVDYEGYTDQRLKISGDRMSNADFKEFLSRAFNCWRDLVKPGASVYVCHSSSCQREFQDALEAAGFEVRCQIIWAKNTFAWGFGRYKFQHEPIFYCHVAGQSDPWYGDKSQSTLWQENKPSANRLHPTMKPVELIERALLNSSKAGDLVFDPFGGSGSTLIACERTGRNARLVEIDPKYADVIVTRWQQLTGKDALLDGVGQTFAEVARQRLPPESPELLARVDEE